MGICTSSDATPAELKLHHRPSDAPKVIPRVVSAKKGGLIPIQSPSHQYDQGLKQGFETLAIHDGHSGESRQSCLVK